MRNMKLALQFAAVGVTAVGCATSPGIKEDKAAAARSQAYVEGMSVVAAGGRGSTGGACAVPSGLNAAAKKTEGPSKDWKDLLGRANTCVSEKNWGTLELLANEMAKADLDSPWAAYYLSVAAEAKGDFPRAMWMVDLAQKKAGGKSGLFLYQRGRVWTRMKEAAKAVADIEKAVMIEPKLTEGHLYLGEIFSRDQDPDKAVGHFRAALAQDEKSYRGLTGLAEALLAKGQGAEAAELYAKAVAAYPSQLQPWVRLAYIYESVQKNNELALSTYKNLKSHVESGSVREKPEFDVNARIKAIEGASEARQPAQASSKKVDEKRSVK